MQIKDDIKVVKIEKIKLLRDNASRGLLEYQKEIEEINLITEEEIIEAERIEKLLFKLGQSRKLNSKKEALKIQGERFAELDATIKDMEKKNKEEIFI